MKQGAALKMAAVLFAAGVLSTPVSSQDERMLDSGGSNRKVLRCNVDGTYTCANERCTPGYCCQYGC